MNKETISLIDFIKKLELSTMDEGQALWHMIASKDVWIDGVYVMTSSFRNNGAQIAEVCGGDYMDYYCSSGSYEARKKIEKKFMDFLVTTDEIQSDSLRFK